MSEKVLKIYYEKEIDVALRAQLMQRESAQDLSAIAVAEEIINKVQLRGKSAILEYTAKFDGVELDEIMVNQAEFDAAEHKLAPELKQAFQQAAGNIKEFHQLQRISLKDGEANIDGAVLGFKYIALEGVGIYVPGGKAAYPSSVLMGLIPAQVAGVRNCLLITPPRKDGTVDPAVLYCARLTGSERVLKVGGAQGIAAAAFGFSDDRIDLIVGPGNRFVTAAKNILSGRGLVRIDAPAGPSEVVIIADDSANPAFVAADMLSQAEHGSDSPAILLTDSIELASGVDAEIQRGILERPHRRAMKEESIRKHSYIIIFDDIADAFPFANEYAAEHLEICTHAPRDDFEKITSAGSVFLGHYAPVALGDYYSGTNHVLPTGGAARFYSGLGVETYMKRITYQHPTRESLYNALNPILLMSQQEGFEQEHGHSVAIRFKTI